MKKYFLIFIVVLFIINRLQKQTSGFESGGRFNKHNQKAVVLDTEAHIHSKTTSFDGNLYQDQQTLVGTALNDTFEASITVDYKYIVTNKGEVQVLENTIQVGEPVINCILNPFDVYKPDYNLSKQINPMVVLTPNSKSIMVIRAFVTHNGLGVCLYPKAPMGFIKQGYEFLGQVNAANPSLSSMSVKAASEYRLYN